MTDFQSERARLAELEALLRFGKFDEAVAMGTELVVQFPDSFLIRLQLARALKENKALLRAQAVLSELADRYGDNITFLIERGDLHRRLGHLDAAEQDYQKILFLDPFNGKIKSALEELEIERKEQKNPAFEEVDYRNDVFRQDQTVPELVMKTDSEPQPVNYEPVIDLDAEPENEQFFNPVSAEALLQEPEPEPNLDISPEEWSVSAPDEESEGTPVGGSEPEDWVQVDISPAAEPVSPAEDSSPNHEMGFVTESAALLYAQQGLYKEALAIYERLGQISHDDKYRQRIARIKGKIAAERQLEYFQKLLTHFTGDRGSYFV